MTSERGCYVYIVPPGATSFVTAGRFRTGMVDGVPVGEFVYRRAYREREDAVELDPVELTLSGAHAAHSTTRASGFFGAIRDAMPDYWGRLVIDRYVGAARLDEFDYLLRGPDDRAGALAFGLGVEPQPVMPRFSRTLDLARVQAAADEVVAGTSAVADAVAIRAEELLHVGTSLGGARPKAVVRDGHDLWIAKFARRDDRWNYPRTEHAMLALARSCGIASADSRVVTVGDRDVLLVRRFDRDWVPESDGGRLPAQAMDADRGGYRRARVASALTVLRSDDAVTERSRWSYILFADEIRRIVADPRADLRELFARMCFNAAISNLDDHPRNHAIIAKRSTWELSPAYDLTPSPVVSLERRDLAMACGHQGRLASRENLLSACGRFLLSESDAAAIFDRTVMTVSSQWRPTMRRAGLSESNCEVVASAFVYPGLLGRSPAGG